MAHIKIFILFVFLLLTSCDNKRPYYIKGNNITEHTEITYIMDIRTGLCFAETGIGYSYTFTCVPCDSLKKINIKFD